LTHEIYDLRARSTGYIRYVRKLRKPDRYNPLGRPRLGRDDNGTVDHE